MADAPVLPYSGAEFMIGGMPAPLVPFWASNGHPYWDILESATVTFMGCHAPCVLVSVPAHTVGLCPECQFHFCSDPLHSMSGNPLSATGALTGQHDKLEKNCLHCQTAVFPGWQSDENIVRQRSQKPGLSAEAAPSYATL
jgi:hypothetical protein